jgi:HK97 family phage major capsid protein
MDFEQFQKNMEESFSKVTGHMETMAGAVKTQAEKMESIEKRLAAQEKAIEEFKNRLDSNKKKGFSRGESVPGSEGKHDGRKFSFLRAARGIVLNDWHGGEFERECFQMTDERRDISKAERDEWQRNLLAGNLQTRDMTTGDDTLGGFIVPTQILSEEFIELLRPNIVVEAMGATVLDDLEGSPVELPKQVGGADADWTPENSNLTPSDLTLGQVNLTPRQIGALVRVSNRLLRMSNPSAEALIRADMARKIAEKFDLAALRGSGASGEPLGIANIAGINTVAIDTNGGRFTLIEADLMRDELANDDALRGRTGYAMHPKVLGRLRRERIAQYSADTGGMYMNIPMSNAVLQEQLDDIFKTTTQIPIDLAKGSGTNLSEVYYANWQELLIGMWLMMELQASNQAGESFQRNQTWIKATMEGDVQVRHPESFCLISDAETQ